MMEKRAARRVAWDGHQYRVDALRAIINAAAVRAGQTRSSVNGQVSLMEACLIYDSALAHREPDDVLNVRERVRDMAIVTNILRDCM